MKLALMSVMLIVGVSWGFVGSQACAAGEPHAVENVWITSPQICVGKPHSSTAKAADWEFIEESRVCRATDNDRPMIASMNPMERGTFFVTVSLRMQDAATIRLFLDEIALDLSDNGQTIHVAGGPAFLKFHVERTEDQNRSRLKISREQETLTVALNGKEVIRFADKGRLYKQVGLKPISGATDVSVFALTGHLHKSRR